MDDRIEASLKGLISLAMLGILKQPLFRHLMATRRIFLYEGDTSPKIWHLYNAQDLLNPSYARTI